jgi:hypothetical protein
MTAMRPDSQRQAGHRRAVLVKRGRPTSLNTNGRKASRLRADGGGRERRDGRSRLVRLFSTSAELCSALLASSPLDSRSVQWSRKLMRSRALATEMPPTPPSNDPVLPPLRSGRDGPEVEDLLDPSEALEQRAAIDRKGDAHPARLALVVGRARSCQKWT